MKSSKKVAECLKKAALNMAHASTGDTSLIFLKQPKLDRDLVEKIKILKGKE